MFKAKALCTMWSFQKGNSDSKEHTGSLSPGCSIPLIPPWDLLVLRIVQKLMEELLPSA